MKINLIQFLFPCLLLSITLSVRADIYFENLTNQNINVKFKVCIEKNTEDNTHLTKSTESKSETKTNSAQHDLNCKKFQDFEANIAAGFRAKTTFNNITVNAINIKVGDKYSEENSLDNTDKQSGCVAEYVDKDQVIRLWLKDPKTAKEKIVCKVFDDKPLETAESGTGKK